MNAKVHEYDILEWEWQPHPPEPGKTWVNDIAGYEIYEIMPDTEAPPLHLKDVKPLGAKAAALPMMWSGSGLRCYGVRAFAEGTKYNSKLVSEMAIHCPGDAVLGTQKIVTELEGWLTDVDRLTVGDDCLSKDDESFFYKNGVGEIFVGSYDVDSDYADCYENVYYTGAIKFNMAASLLPAGAVLQNAFLHFTSIYKHYNSEKTASKGPDSCVSSVGKANKPWTGFSDADHWIATVGLGGFGAPMKSVPDYGPIVINVTSVVSGWLKNPTTNHGFIIYGDNYPSGNYAYCVSGLGKFWLDMYYLAP
jgi:hypothetical protein